MKNNNGWARLFLAVVLCLTITLAACSTAWVGEAEQVVAALIPAATNIVALVAALQGKSVSAGDLQTIQQAGTQAGADLQLIQALITAYQQADATAKPGILNQIQTAIGTVQANLQALLPALHIQDTATQTKITAVVGIVLSEVQSLAAIVPLVSANASPAMMAKAVQKNAPLSAAEFVKSYNATLTAKTGNAELDRATAGFQIHLHGKVARWGTAGLLK
ncbi:MAG TPA: hypothetical protein VGM18_15045 [Candidatus Sulfotelmatobacter sp.]|jgi:hypothetical protein